MIASFVYLKDPQAIHRQTALGFLVGRNSQVSHATPLAAFLKTVQMQSQGRPADRGQVTAPAAQSMEAVQTPPSNVFYSQTHLFNKDFIYMGEWRLQAPSDLVTQDPSKIRGDALCVFTYDWYPNSIQFVVNFRDKPYSDSQHLALSLSLLYSEYNPEAATFTFTPDQSGLLRVDRFQHLAYREANYSDDYVAQIRLVHSITGEPFVLDTTVTDPSQGWLDEPVNTKSAPNDLTSLKVLLSLDAPDLGLSVSAEMAYAPDFGSSFTQPVVFMVLILAALMLIIEGSNQLEEDPLDYIFLGNISYGSLFLLTIIHFQYIGAFVLFMVVANTSFVLFFIFASIITTFSTIFVYKVCFIAFLVRYMSHPQIHLMAWNSPRILFTFGSLVALVGSYSLSIFLVGFPSYAYFLLGLHTFPLLHVYNSVMRGTRQTFSRYLQGCLWWPSALFAIMLRGYDGNMLNLQPSYLMTVCIVVSLVAGTAISYLQRERGPYFFLPRLLIPGYNRMLTSIAAVPDEKLLDNCSVCYCMILADPTVEKELEMVDLHQEGALKESLVRKGRHVMRTPCGHYFHENCLTTWLEMKQECPVCKSRVTYL